MRGRQWGLVSFALQKRTNEEILEISVWLSLERVLGCVVWKVTFRKRKKHGFEIGGWYVYLDFHGVISQQNVPTPEIRTHVSYVSKRNFLYNAPQYVCMKTHWTDTKMPPKERLIDFPKYKRKFT